MAAESPIRIGVLGCAEIARKVSRAIHLAPNATVSAVASRSAEKAKAFAAANGYPPTAKIHGSYESLLNDPDVDALYVPLPTSLHVEWAVRAAEKGKHLLLEKPVAMNVAEFDKIIAACESNGIQIMDGTMWVHNPRTQKMKEYLSDPELFGQLKTVHSCFSFAGDEDFLKNDIRVKPGLDGLGALGDAGWYTIRATLLANNYELPKSVTALPGPILNEAGVILSCSAFLHWEDGRTATISCSFLANLTMDITAVGTKGTLHVHDFIIPFQETEASFSTSTKAWFNEGVTGWVNKPSEHKIMTELPQEACMVREFARLVGEIKNRGAKPDGFWPSISRKTQLVIDAVKESIGKNFEPIDLSGR
ncbi:PREDICTED: uncharacterized oxidoreductase At4g09670-like isoform X1 [Tarenaya hassleriana]|uniref:uncharacterized oxidoreductase At4g09670-like isoform X2 n=1 Tax=Tarenaya hassleriana TaxID=28532 RepID=UPI00053C4024|nr:PREDICTED: uncharacterized oxidoreductase At4g09670-like isoform X2 [Tarenaya hassleriana]XP_019057274.1 PREDICTED: uncharacterized oxidoreductase At4g09670-like isoform X1 [Tarenaya hassleriana]